MSERELAGRPDLAQYRKQAKELVREQRLGLTAALERVKRHHPRFHGLGLEDIRGDGFALADAQLVIARQLSFESWPKLVRFVTTITSSSRSQLWLIRCRRLSKWHAYHGMRGIGMARWNMPR